MLSAEEGEINRKARVANQKDGARERKNRFLGHVERKSD